MDPQKMRDLALGAMLGLAAGDALGCPFRGRRRHEIELEIGMVLEMTADGRRGCEPGQWGVETRQALAVLESYLSGTGFDGEDISLRLVEITEEDPTHYDREWNSIMEVLAEDPERFRTAAVEVWYDRAGTYITNRALTRCIVPAIRHAGNFDRLIEDTIRVCQVTHYDPRCVDAALVVAFVINRCMQDRFHADLLNQACNFIDNLHEVPDYRRLVLDFDEARLREQPNVTPLEPYYMAKDEVTRELRLIRELSYDDLGTSDHVVHTLQTAMWALFNSESVEEGVSKVVSLGGQADTQGAVAGALLGARFGFNRIPTSWLKILAGRPKIINLTEMLLGEIGT
jgi:ADP-ribosylglycohydrolase